MTKSVARLITQYEPEHYTLNLQPNAESMTFTGQVVISGRKIGKPSKRLTFHQNGLKVTAARITHHDKKGDIVVDVPRINTHKSLMEVRLHTERLLYAGTYTVELSFEGIITPDMNGLYPCFFTKDGEQHTMLMTQFESHFARDVFPCIDEPEAKATFDLTLTSPKGQTVLANTPVVTQHEDGGSLVTTFERTPRMSTYLLAFIIGELHSVHTKTASGVEVGIWGTIAQPKESFDFALDVAKRSIEFFEDYFGVPYPLAKADHVAMPDFSAGAMENWGLVTYREIALLAYPGETAQSSKELIATVIAHETSHQWFGNLVTMRWWNDLWLNESFANMMEYRAVDALFPEWDIWSTFYGQEGLSALRRDATPGVQAIKTDVHHPDEINTLFDPSIVYAKGGRLLYMLMEYIGEEAFRKGLAAYFKTHAYGNTEGKDLWKALSEASGKNIGTFMDPWLDRAGFPLITVQQTGTTLDLEQTHFLDTPEKVENGRTWPVPLFARRHDAPEVMTSLTHTSKLEDDEFVFLNSNGAGHYLVHYANPEHWKAVTRRVSSGDLSEVDRLMLLNTSSMLARAGYASFGEALELLEAYRQETTEPVWDMMAVTIGDAKRFVDVDERLEAPLKHMVGTIIADEFNRLGWDELPGEPSADTKLRATIIGLGAYAEVPAITKRALELFAAYQKDPNNVHTELRGIVFGVAVKKNDPAAIEYLLNLHHETQSSDLKRDIAAALTITQSADVATRILGLLKDPTLIKPQDADRWLAFLLRNRYTRKTAWDWMVANWGWIEETYGRDKSYDYMPRYAAAACNTAEWQKRFDALFDDKIDNPLLRRNILIGKEEITARVKWLKRDIAAVQKYFNL